MIKERNPESRPDFYIGFCISSSTIFLFVSPALPSGLVCPPPRNQKNCARSPGGDQWNPKYGCKGTVTTRFALIALVAWQY